MCFVLIERNSNILHTKKRRFSRVQGFFEILELKFTSVNEHFKISKVTKKLALVKNAKKNYIFLISTNANLFVYYDNYN